MQLLLDQIISETSESEIYEEEFKIILSLSIMAKIPFNEILEMPNSRFEYVLEVMNELQRDSEFIGSCNSNKLSGGLIGK